jgi:hypothetical protein
VIVRSYSQKPVKPDGDVAVTVMVVTPGETTPFVRRTAVPPDAASSPLVETVQPLLAESVAPVSVIALDGISEVKTSTFPTVLIPVSAIEADDAMPKSVIELILMDRRFPRTVPPCNLVVPTTFVLCESTGKPSNNARKTERSLLIVPGSSSHLES